MEKGGVDEDKFAGVEIQKRNYGKERVYEEKELGEKVTNSTGLQVNKSDNSKKGRKKKSRGAKKNSDAKEESVAQIGLKPDDQGEGEDKLNVEANSIEDQFGDLQHDDLKLLNEYAHGMVSNTLWWLSSDIEKYEEKDSQLPKALSNLKTLYDTGLLGRDRWVRTFWRLVRKKLENNSEPHDAQGDGRLEAGLERWEE